MELQVAPRWDVGGEWESPPDGVNRTVHYDLPTAVLGWLRKLISRANTWFALSGSNTRVFKFNKADGILAWVVAAWRIEEQIVEISSPANVSMLWLFNNFLHSGTWSSELHRYLRDEHMVTERLILYACI